MEEIIERAKKGDNQAFTVLITNIQCELYKIAKLRLKSDDDINEAVQETIIKAYSSIKKLKNNQYFKTWIIKILINECNSIYQKNKKNQFEEYDENINIYENIDNINQKISELDFFILIENLKYEEKIAITLYYLEGLSTKEISKILKQPEATIKTRISRSKEKIKRTLKWREEEWINLIMK